MTKRLFHLISDADYKELEKSEATWRDIIKKYRQPPWCGYPNALGGLAGCWSLVYRMVTGEKFCVGCDCYRAQED